MMRKTICLFVFIIAALPVAAQQSVAEAAAQAKSKTMALSPDAPSHEQVITLLNLLQIRKNMAVMMEDLPLDEMVEAMVPIYQRHLTRSDIEEVIRFYSSPVGQKLLREQPQMIQEGMQAGAQIEQQRMGRSEENTSE